MKASDRDVMRLFDGELDAEASRRLSSERLRDPSVDARLAGLLQVAAFTRTWARERGVRFPVRAPRRKARVLPVAFGFGGVALALAVVCIVPRFGRPSVEATEGTTAAALPAAAVAVEHVDFGAHAGTIFSVSAAGTETTVVWLSDDANENSLAL
jgi:hypothetical protein